MNHPMEISCSELHWADNAIINMYARRRELRNAFAYARTLHDMTSFTYSALLNACAKVLA